MLAAVCGNNSKAPLMMAAFKMRLFSSSSSWLSICTKPFGAASAIAAPASATSCKPWLKPCWLAVVSSVWAMARLGVALNKGALSNCKTCAKRLKKACSASLMLPSASHTPKAIS